MKIISALTALHYTIYLKNMTVPLPMSYNLYAIKIQYNPFRNIKIIKMYMNNKFAIG